MKNLFSRSILIVFFFSTLSSFSFGQNGHWQTDLQANPTIKAEYSSCVFDGKIYVFGGYIKMTGADYCFFGSYSVEVYDPETNTWDLERSQMPTPRVHTTAEVINNKIYIIGGTSGSPHLTRYNDIEVYDPILDKWEESIPMSAYRYGSASCVVNNELYIIGGIDNNSQGISLVERYNPKNGVWERKAEMPTARGQLTADYINGKIYAIGGVYEFYPLDTITYNPMHDIEVYDVSTNTWSIYPGKLPIGLSHHSALTHNGLIYIAGGKPSDYSRSDDYFHYTKMIALNPSVQKIFEITSLPYTALNVSFHQIKGEFFIIGGRNIGIIESLPDCSDIFTNLNYKYTSVKQALVAYNGTLSQTFLDSGLDSLSISTTFLNPDKTPLVAFARIRNSQGFCVDSTEIHDDGLHEDALPSDGVFGAWISNVSEEDIYTVDIASYNTENQSRFISSGAFRPFCTIGPLRFRTSTPSSKEYSNEEQGQDHSMDLEIKNYGKRGQAMQISVDFFCEDSDIVIQTKHIEFGNILPGEVKKGSEKFIFQLKPNMDKDKSVQIQASIESEGISYWFDSFELKNRSHRSK